MQPIGFRLVFSRSDVGILLSWMEPMAMYKVLATFPPLWGIFFAYNTVVLMT